MTDGKPFKRYTDDIPSGRKPSLVKPPPPSPSENSRFQRDFDLI